MLDYLLELIIKFGYLEFFSKLGEFVPFFS
jgi:hypothetical protein